MLLISEGMTSVGQEQFDVCKNPNSIWPTYNSDIIQTSDVHMEAVAHTIGSHDIQVQPWYSRKLRKGLGDSRKVLSLRLRGDSDMRTGSLWDL